MRLRRRLVLVAATVAALGASTVASADNIQIEGVDSSGVVTAAPGSSVVIGWKVHQTGNDGCSAETGAPVVVSVSPSGPVSASASTLTFTSCGSSQSVTFTVAGDAAPGDYPVTVSASDADESIGGDTTAIIRVPEPTPPPPPPDTTPPVVTAPADQMLEATSSAGATQSFSGTAVDDVDGPLSAPCLPTSYPIGSTTVTCTATDTAGNSGSATFTVTVQDTTGPALSLPGPIVTEATSAAGATVSYTVSGNDLVAGAVGVSCAPVSGSTFPMGVTAVNCSATDGVNTSAGSFSVTVTNSAPTITVPGPQIVEAFDAAGAKVNFIPEPTANDPQDGALVPTCSHASGSQFPLGATTVTCTAVDSGGAPAAGSFQVVVRDTTPPVVTPPLNAVIVTDTPLSLADPRVAQFLAGAVAVDLVGVVRLESNAPPIFPLGLSTVTFTAVDAAGNAGGASATIELRPPLPGQPLPPASPPPAVRVPPANVADLRVRPIDGGAWLEWRAAPRATRYVVNRSDRAGATRSVYDGPARSFIDRGLVNGQEYRYVVVSYDAAGLRSVGVAVVAVPARPILVSPAHGAGVSRPPLLTWRRVSGATYYNLQLLRVSADGARTKVLSTWPVRSRLQLRRTWRYGGKKQRLTAGTYEWYVWAGIGARAAETYSGLLGWSRFSVKPATR
jgi:hypothetical protein